MHSPGARRNQKSSIFDFTTLGRQSTTCIKHENSRKFGRKICGKKSTPSNSGLHEDGYTHTGMFTEILHATSYQISTLWLTHILTDIKPDNILVNYGTGSSRFADVQLADFGDVTRIDPKNYLKVGMDGPHMGAAIFRSPEAMMQLRWGQSTDIWSFGTTVGVTKQVWDCIVWIRSRFHSL